MRDDQKNKAELLQEADGLCSGVGELEQAGVLLGGVKRIVLLLQRLQCQDGT